MKVRDIMTAKPVCIPPETSLVDAARRMRDLDVGSLPICADDRLIGMVTDRDLVVRGLAADQDPKSRTVRDVMCPGIVFCLEENEVEAAARIMEDRQIRRLPVINEQKRMVGIISLGDIATRLADDEVGGEILERVSEPSHAGA